MATPSAMAFSSSTCESVFPSGANDNRSGVARATDLTGEARRFSVITPSGVTRANVRRSTRPWRADCPPTGVNSSRIDEPTWSAWSPGARLEESARVRSVTRPQVRETRRPIRKRRLRNAARGLDFVFIARISDAPMNLVLFKNACQQISAGQPVLWLRRCVAVLLDTTPLIASTQRDGYNAFLARSLIHRSLVTVSGAGAASDAA